MSYSSNGKLLDLFKVNSDNGNLLGLLKVNVVL